ncbi:hypothetical protein LTR33_019142, partial [Friedmanniomyces endolithicus]
CSGRPQLASRRVQRRHLNKKDDFSAATWNPWSSGHQPLCHLRPRFHAPGCSHLGHCSTLKDQGRSPDQAVQAPACPSLRQLRGSPRRPRDRS